MSDAYGRIAVLIVFGVFLAWLNIKATQSTFLRMTTYGLLVATIAALVYLIGRMVLA